MIAVTSPGFVLFAALLAGLWYACPPPRRWQLLLGANLLFYAVLCPAALPVLAGSSFLVWWCGRRTAKKPVFLAGLAAALLPLALLKYLPAALGWQGTLANALGIGYFTLQLVSYLCDVRRGRILPEEKYARLLCYASFFLSITQGPFNRYDALMPQLDRPTVWDTDRVWRGVQRSAWGYFKKLAVADRAAVVVDTVFANPAAFDRTQLLLGAEAMTKLHDSRVAVFGVGGVGGYTVEALARSGVGALDLIDDDKVCLTNLNRQIVATRKTVGQYKVDVAEQRIHEIDPNIKVTTYKIFFTPETQDQFDFTQYDYVVDAIDTVTGKIALVVKAKEAGVPIICSMGAGNKMDPTRFEVTDIYKTSVCPLAKVMRTECRKRRIKHLKVVYSKEPAMTPIEDDSISCKQHCICPPGTQRKCTVRRSVPGSNAFVPSVAGLIIGGEVVKDLVGFVPLKG